MTCPRHDDLSAYADALGGVHHVVRIGGQIVVAGASHGKVAIQRGIFASNPARARAMRDLTGPMFS